MCGRTEKRKEKRRKQGLKRADGGGRRCRRGGFLIHAVFNEQLREFREQVKALVHTSDPEVLKNIFERILK